MHTFSPQQHRIIDCVLNADVSVNYFTSELTLALPEHISLKELCATAKEFLRSEVIENSYYRQLFSRLELVFSVDDCVSVSTAQTPLQLEQGQLLQFAITPEEKVCVTTSALIADSEVLIIWLNRWLCEQGQQDADLDTETLIAYLWDEITEEESQDFWCHRALNQTSDISLESTTYTDHHTLSSEFILTTEQEQQLSDFCAEQKCDLENFMAFAWSQTLQLALPGCRTQLGRLVPCREMEELQSVAFPLARVIPVLLQPANKLNTALQQFTQEYLECAEFAEGFQLNLENDCINQAFDFVFQYQKVMNCSLDIYGCRSRLEPVQLSFHVVQRSQEIRIQLNYTSDLFQDEDASSLFRLFMRILQGMSQLTLTESLQLTKLSGEVCKQALKLKQQAQPFEQDNLVALYASQGGPDDSCAIRSEQEETSWQVMESESNQLARFLQEYCGTENKVVGLVASASNRMAIAALAILKASLTILPIDPQTPAERLKTVLDDANCDFILGEQAYLDVVADLGRELLILDRDWYEVQEFNCEALAHCPAPESTAYIIYTSGSTGTPKGVAVPHRAIANYVQAIDRQAALPVQGDYLAFSAISADLGYTTFFTALCLKRTLRLFSKDQMLDAQLIARSLKAKPVAVMKAVPSHFLALFNQEPAIVPTQVLFLGGEVCPADINTRLAAEQVSCRVFNHYGPTETTVGVLINEISELQLTSDVPLGEPLLNNQVWVLDKDLNQVPFNHLGDLYITGANLSSGYLNQAEMTEAVFIEHSEFGRLYRSGDKARVNLRGQVCFHGREDEQVKIRGFRVELAEIEQVIRQCQAVVDVAVVVNEHNLCAAVVTDGEVTNDALVQSVSAKLLNHMLPNKWLSLPAIPRRSNGKVDTSSLRNLLKQDSDMEYAGARTPVENVLCQAFEEVFNLKKVGIHQNFFHLGGDSIIGIQLTSRARKSGVFFNPGDLFEYPTVAQLAQIATQSEASQLSDEPTGDLVLSPIAARYFAENEQDLAYNNQSVLMQVRHPLAEAGIRQVVDTLFAHHDVLRSGFTSHQGQWTHTIPVAVEPVNVHFLQSDLTDPSAIQQWVQKECAEQQTLLSLAVGELCKVLCFNCDNQQYLAMIVHHLLVDGISWRVLIGDLCQLLVEPNAALPEKTVGYRYWSNQQNADSVDGRELSFWQAQASACQNNLFSLTQKPASYRNVKVADVELDANVTQSLLEGLNQQYGFHANEVLITGLLKGLQQVRNISELTLLMESHGRQSQLDLSRTVGWFTNMYPVNLTLSNDRIEGDIIGIQQKLDEASQYQNYNKLRYQHPDKAVRESVACRPGVCFNYLGRLDADANRYQSVDILSWELGENRSPKHELQALLTFNLHVSDGQLHIACVYPENLFLAAEINDILSAYQSALNNMAALSSCKRDEQAVARQLHRLNPDLGDVAQLAVLPQDIELSHLSSVLPIGSNQLGMLVHSDTTQATKPYIIQSVIAINDNVNVKGFELAWQQVVNRHEIFRTRFVGLTTEVPCQLVYDKVTLPFSYCDWSTLSVEELEAQLNELCLKRKQQKLGIEAPCAMTLDLIKQRQGRFCFVWTMHHAVCDGWSKSILLNEWYRFYEANISGGIVQLSQPAPQYREYMDHVASQDRGAAKVFWQHYLQDVNEGDIRSLPFDSRGASANSSQPEIMADIDPELINKLQAQCAEHQSTLSTFFQVAWGILISKFTHRDETLIGVTSSGRSVEQEQSFNIVGPLLNTLPVRVKSQASDVFADLLHVRFNEFKECEAHTFMPLSEIAQCAHVTPGESLFNTIVVYDNYPDMGSSDQGEQLSLLRYDSYNHFPLTLVVVPGNDYKLIVKYRPDSISTELANTLFSSFNCVLAQLAESWNVCIGELSLLSTEQTQVVVTMGQGEQQDFSHEDLVSLYYANVPDDMKKAAVVTKSDSFSYQALEEQSNQLAHCIDGIVGDNTAPVALLMHAGFNLVQSMIAVIKSGRPFLPLDPDAPEGRIAAIVEAANCELVLSEQGLIDSLAEVSCELLLVDRDAYEWEVCSKQQLEHSISAQDTAYLIYTSGSTGTPKGVVISHGAISNYIQGIEQKTALGPDGLWGSFASVASDLGHTALFGALCFGRSLRTFTKAELLSPQRLCASLREKPLTFLKVVPSYFSALLATSKDVLPESLLMFGGESLPPALVNRLLESGWQGRVFNHYGPTETAVGVLCQELTVNHSRLQSPLGRPIANNQVLVLDQQQQVLPVGAIGELYISGKNLADGYLRNDVETAKSFVSSPLADERRMYKTGDLVSFTHSGDVVFHGRQDQQVKINGFRVELSEIEYALIQQNGVTDGACTYHKEQGVQAWVTGDVDQGELQRAITRVLPPHMLPKAIHVLSAIPRKINGKVDRKALPAPCLANHVIEFQAPETDTEIALAKMWAKLLKVEADSISRLDEFFALGGHSLLSIRLISEIRQGFQVEIEVSDIYSHSTLRGLASWISARDKVCGLPAITPVARGRSHFPLSYGQQRLWFLDKIQGGSPEFNMPVLLKVKGQFDLARAAKVLSYIVKRHEVLRTVYEEGAQGPLQRVNDPVQVVIQDFDLSYISHGERAKAVKRMTLELASKPFDLSKDLMLKAAFIHQEKAVGTHVCGVLVINIHHIASDGWSMDILTNEFCQLYRTCQKEQAPELSALPVQFVDYASWQQRLIEEGYFDSQLAYWQKQLSGLPEDHGLLLDKARPTEKQFGGGKVENQLCKESTDKLQQLGFRLQLTPFMLMHSALSLVMTAHSNRTDIVIGTLMANRRTVELDHLMGMFINTLILRTRTDFSDAFEYLQHVKQVHLSAQANQDIPFEKILEVVRRNSDGSPNSLFQILLTTRNEYGVLEQGAEQQIDGVIIENYVLDDAVTKFDITIDITMKPEGVCTKWVYDESLFDHEHIKQLDSDFCLVLERLAELASAEVSSAKLRDVYQISSTEHSFLLQDLNITAASYDRSLCIHEMFEAQVASQPDHVAVSMADKRLTYAELNAKANQLADYLRSQHDVSPDRLVGLCLERSIEMVVGLLAILKAGAAYVPLDPDYPRERLNYVLEEAELSVVLSQAQVQQRQAFSDTHVVLLDSAIDDGGWLSNYSKSNVKKEILGLNSSHLAYVIYTSGSTGQPKGVMVEHRALVNRIDWMDKEYGCDSSDKILQKTPFSFDVSVWEFVWTLGKGAELVMAIPGGHKDPRYLLEVIQQSGITKLHFVPSMLELILQHPDLSRCQSVQQVFCSGEALQSHHVKAFQARLPNTQLHNLYGPTEAAIDVSYWDCAHFDGGDVPIGQPIQNIQLLVLDKELNIVPYGVPGELYIGGDGLARGYLNKPELTAKSFISNPFYSQESETGAGSSKRLYRTGDLVRYRSDGQLLYLGREDDQVKIRGFRIELGEISQQLSNHRLVESALALAQDSKQGKQLVGYVKVTSDVDDETALINKLLAELRTSLPAHMVPAGLALVAEWPLTSNGKVDKKALPDVKVSSVQQVYVAPQTDVELALVDVWAELLGLDASAISVDDNFFELGGHSLLAVRLIMALKTSSDIELEIKDIFANPSLREFAVLVEREMTQVFVARQKANAEVKSQGLL